MLVCVTSTFRGWGFKHPVQQTRSLSSLCLSSGEHECSLKRILKLPLCLSYSSLANGICTGPINQWCLSISRAILDTQDAAVTKADWVPVSNGSESSTLPICVYKWRSRSSGVGSVLPVAPSPLRSIWSHANTTSNTWPFRMLRVITTSRKGESTGPKARQWSHSASTPAPTKYIEGVHVS